MGHGDSEAQRNPYCFSVSRCLGGRNPPCLAARVDLHHGLRGEKIDDLFDAPHMVRDPKLPSQASRGVGQSEFQSLARIRVTATIITASPPIPRA